MMFVGFSEYFCRWRIFYFKPNDYEQTKEIHP